MRNLRRFIEDIRNSFTQKKRRKGQRKFRKKRKGKITRRKKRKKVRKEKNVRKFAIVGILVLAALVTPPDVITQIILFVVVYGLYEVSIFLVARTEKQIEKQFSDDDYSQDTGDDFDDPIIKDFDEKK